MFSTRALGGKKNWGSSLASFMHVRDMIEFKAAWRSVAVPKHSQSDLPSSHSFLEFCGAENTPGSDSCCKCL